MFEDKNSSDSFNFTLDEEINYSLYSKCYAVYIGVGEYLTLRKLNGPPNDARQIKSTFEKLGFEVPKEYENILINKQVTKESVENLLDRLEEEVKFDDESLFVFYFSGHGETINQDYYLCPHDWNEEQIDTKIHFFDSIVKKVERFKSKHKLFILDACYGGSIFDL